MREQYTAKLQPVKNAWEALDANKVGITDGPVCGKVREKAKLCLWRRQHFHRLQALWALLSWGRAAAPGLDRHLPPQQLLTLGWWGGVQRGSPPCQCPYPPYLALQVNVPLVHCLLYMFRHRHDPCGI